MAEIENFVEIAVEAAVEETAPEEIIHSFATIGAVTENGVTLIFDGETEASTKEYLCNTSIFFEAGQRVKLCRDSGTYVVEYIVGAPKANKPPQYVPAAGADGQYLAKNGAEDYALKWLTPPHDLPEGGSNGQFLIKNGSGNYVAAWGNGPTNHIPSGGSNGQLLAKDGSGDYDLKWVAVPHDLPTGGSAGYMLVKDSANNYDVKWAAAPSERVPTGGSDGQLLAKNGSTDRALKWVTAPVNRVPSGGSTGQVLTKTSSTDYATSWQTPSLSQLKYSSYTLALNSSKVLLPSTSGFALGAARVPLGIHTDKIILYYSTYRYVTLTCNSSGKLCVDGTAIN